MAPLRAALLALVLTSAVATSEHSSAAAGNAANPIRRVVTMMQDLSSKQSGPNPKNTS